MGLNKEQQQAVDSNSDRILCLAPAGSGKTHTFIERISRLVKDGVAPSSILALTFTNNAAAEMKARYEKQNIGKEIPEFRTFHSFCYSLICKDPLIRSALGYTTVPGIASDEQEKSIKERALIQCKITISKAKLASREGLNREEQRQVELYDKAVRRLMLMENLITFDMLNSQVSDLFVKDNPATKQYKEQYIYILSDECQDIDPHQFNFLSSFYNSNFFLVGDSQQNIYSFRGTSNEYIKILSKTPDWEKIRLYTNYRSTNQICEYANKFSKKYADESYWIEMKGTRDGEKVVTKLIESPSKYSSIDTRNIADVLKENDKLTGTSAILCRTNKEVGAIISYLRDNNIEFTTNHGNKLYYLIECALSDTFMLGWLSSYLSSSKYGEYIRLSTQIKNPDLYWFLGVYGNVSQIKEDVNSINLLKNIANNSDSMSDKMAMIANAFHITYKDDSKQDYVGIEFLQHLKDTLSDDKSSELYVGTIHSVKGLEYDNVFVMNVGSYNFRLTNEDEKNLFYVAVTRAKNRLFVYELFDS